MKADIRGIWLNRPYAPCAARSSFSELRACLVIPYYTKLTNDEINANKLTREKINVVQNSF